MREVVSSIIVGIVKFRFNMTGSPAIRGETVTLALLQLNRRIGISSRRPRILFGFL